MSTPTSFRDFLRLLWQTLQLYGRHFLPLFLIGGLPGLLYHLFLLALGHAPAPKSDPEAVQILPPALRTFFLWNLPNLLVLGPLVSGALVAAAGQFHQPAAPPTPEGPPDRSACLEKASGCHRALLATRHRWGSLCLLDL